MQNILVCAQDSVLAKKVRFLLARDEVDVEILPRPSQLERRLKERPVQLLVLSRSLDGDDAVEILARFDPTLAIPQTLVLGGPKTVTADFIHLIPDPIDTQAIYRKASELLSEYTGPEPFSADEDLTHIAVDPPAPRSTTVKGDVESGTDERTGDEELSFTDVTGLDEIAGRLDQLESDQLNDQLSDAFDIDEASGLVPARPPPPPANTVKTRPAQNEPPVLGGLLEPARFAKVLFQCWSKSTTGALIVARDHETLTVHFEKGAPIHVESSVPGDPLGRALVMRGRITEAQYADGAKRAIERGIRLGLALVELGLFSKEELGRELGTSAREQIVGCFEARQGAFEFDSKRKAPQNERPYRLEIAHILAEGLKRHADDAVLTEILGDINPRYFRLKKSIESLRSVFPLTQQETEFLRFSGKAYNVADASEVSGLFNKQSHKLLALLMVCEEVEDFTPGIAEFESRIREERQRSRDLEVQASVPPSPSASGLPAIPKKDLPGKAPSSPGLPVASPSMPPPIPGPALGSLPPPVPSATPSPFAPPAFSQPPAFAAPPPPPAPSGEEIPPMPVPAGGDEGVSPRPLVYAKPLPRGPDGSPLETPERALSREHFQRGVTLLGQGNFASAEEAFRDAVALCSEEHVYLIGLARAIYYNPAYQAGGKVPVLKAIVGRAGQLAPEDKRVATLKGWVDHAEAQL
ncbi:MAG: DUF4388 domain-containing protein [Deltaproteobacteria bacterium]|jgi:hypothetical protein|nr:DUF4388 domain-containing protein [Deltaproteobacteria bacterium]